MSDIEARVFAAFQVEFPEHLEHLRAMVAAVERGEQPDTAKAMRHAHNLKGAARAVDLSGVEQLAHGLESLLAAAGRGERMLRADMAPVLHQVLDTMEDQVAAAARGASSADPAAALTAIERLSASPTAADPATRLQAAAETPEDTMRVASRRVDRLLGSAAQLLTEGRRQELLLQEVAALCTAVDELSREWHRNPRSGQARSRMDARVQGLSRSTRRLYRMQVESLWAVQQHGRRLHDEVRRIMLVPARTVFEGFPKLVRDLSRTLGKPLDLDMEGVEVQADRRVLQIIKDPLVHLLRNAAHHGIESAAERAAAGKPTAGQIRVTLQTSGNRLTARVQDDGRGIDANRVAQEAMQRGLIARGESLASTEVYRLLFRPGFSTASEVTELSGRGVGLSVVQEAVSRLQGDVHVEQPASGGTVFALTVPLSMSVQRLLLVQGQGQTFGLPTSAVERLYRLSGDIVHVEGHPVLPTSSGPVPLHSLVHLLFDDDTPPPRPTGHLAVVVVKSAGRRLAIAVDAFAGRVDGVLQGLGPVSPPGLRVSAGIVLGDGSICLVLNPADLLELARQSSPPMAMALPAGPPAAVPDKKMARSVLVVDDSFTTRTLEKGILESNGYEVRVAVDGLDALGQLRLERPDLMIVDVQMPRMDGFELLAALKNDANLAHIPVIMVTSLESREDQERGLSLGADAYIVKRRFEQHELLETVRQLL